jgi:HAD superfamily hydrolase (TIGR01509 family)
LYKGGSFTSGKVVCRFFYIDFASCKKYIHTKGVIVWDAFCIFVLKDFIVLFFLARSIKTSEIFPPVKRCLIYLLTTLCFFVELKGFANLRINKCKMKQIKTALFDFDGVIVDTEPIYDIFWNEASIRYNIGIDNFADIIKGTTLPDIIKKHFADRFPEEVRKLISESVEYESNMPLPAMPGSIEFLRLLKANGVRMGLVTSSDMAKIERASAIHHLNGLFDTIVTADRITQGKPNPMCYLLAASDLNLPPSDCLVFEDSFNGIQSALSAGMRVIGLSTTNPAETLEGKVYQVIPNFNHLTFESYIGWSD